MNDEDLGKCPRCDEHTMMTPIEINALRRTTREANDVSMWVCSNCGTDEGVEEAFFTAATPQTEWPVTERTFSYFINEIEYEYAILQNESEEYG